nr:hypothetical protein [Verminephrobacter eiseniae]
MPSTLLENRGHIEIDHPLADHRAGTATMRTRRQLAAAMVGNALEYDDVIVYAFLATDIARHFLYADISDPARRSHPAAGIALELRCTHRAGDYHTIFWLALRAHGQKTTSSGLLHRICAALIPGVQNHFERALAACDHGGPDHHEPLHCTACVKLRMKI